jgi:hypothetical protein
MTDQVLSFMATDQPTARCVAQSIAVVSSGRNGRALSGCWAVPSKVWPSIWMMSSGRRSAVERRLNAFSAFSAWGPRRPRSRFTGVSLSRNRIACW